MTTPAGRTTSIKTSKLLLVEGLDDFYFFLALLNHFGDLEEIQVMPYEGKDNLDNYLKTLQALAGFNQVNSLGFLRDADQDKLGAFTDVTLSLKKAGLPSPNAPGEPFGTNPQVIVDTMPIQGSEGELEDVLLAAVGGDPAMTCVDTYVDCLEALPSGSPKKLSKTRLHTFLASKETPGLKIGEAAKAHYFPWESESFAPIIEFLHKI